MDMVTLPGAILLAALVAGGAGTGVNRPEAAGPQYAQATCKLSGQSRAGARKICYYDCGGVTRTMAIPPAKVCPHQMKR